MHYTHEHRHTWTHTRTHTDTHQYSHEHTETHVLLVWSGLILLAVFHLAMVTIDSSYVLRIAFSLGMMDGQSVFLTSRYILCESIANINFDFTLFEHFRISQHRISTIFVKLMFMKEITLGLHVYFHWTLVTQFTFCHPISIYNT